MRGDVFAKVGDSNTEMPGAYYGFTCTRAPLELPPSLSRMVSKFNRQPVANPDPLPGCRRETSFARHSVAARTGTLSFWPIYPITKMPDRGYWNKPEGCAQNQTPLDCELKATRPRYALIMSGTNDIGAAIYFRGVPGSDTSARVSRMITICRSYGVIPVISSLPRIFSDIPGDQAKFDKGVERANHDLFQLARKRKAPFVNIWRAMNEPQMVNSGIYDGLHLGIYGWSDPDQGTIPYPAAFTNSVIFTRKALRYGANRRNLIMLKTLARLDQAIG